MTNLAADKDALRARISGMLHQVEGILGDALEQIIAYNREVPNTILEGDRTTLDYARRAVETIRKGIDRQRGVTR